jgi:predicted small integral membrane protein
MDGMDLADALFFAFIALALDHADLACDLPAATPRQGILGFPTTRGDRFFVSLIGSAFIFILWMRFDGGALWYPLALSFLYGIAMFKFA